MGLPTSGAISINQIATEFGCAKNLLACAQAAGISTSNIAMSNFYGLSSVIVTTVTGTKTDLNLYSLAGSISTAEDFLFIFDGANIGSTDVSIPAVTAGGFNPASNITVVCINGTRWMAHGGKGGNIDDGGTGGFDFRVPGGAGGYCYLSGGVSTDIYISGNYTGVNGQTYNANGTLYAPGGGGGSAYVVGNGVAIVSSGGGGSGINGGKSPEPQLRDLGFGSQYYYQGAEGTKDAGGLGGKGNKSGSVANGGDGGDPGQPGDNGYYGGYDVGGTTGSPGAAGAAIKGANVTVYKTGSALLSGNSDSFTTVEV